MTRMNRPGRRRALAVLVAVLATSAIACGSDATGSGAASSSTTAPATSTTAPTTAPTTQVRPVVPGQVDMIDYELLPPTITIAAGESVTWLNGDDVDHFMLTEDGTTVDSGPILPGEAYAATLTTPGTYPYYCDIHNAMTGTIVVE
jgi:plastocyanin